MVDKLKTHKGFILAIIALAQFMVVLDVAIVNVALPTIFRTLHFHDAGDLQWVVTAYILAFGGFLLLGGRAADLYGRKKTFLIGVIAFTVTSLLCGLAPNHNFLIFARGLEGLSAAFMSPAALSIILTVFKEGKERNRALGVWAAVAAGGAAFGVLLGGILTQYLTWRWDFFVNVPVGIFVILTTIRYIPESKGDLGHNHLDLPGAATVTLGLMSLVYALTQTPSKGWTSAYVLTFFAISALLLIAFVVNENHSKHPLVPFSIFKIGNVAGANLVSLPLAASLFSMFFFLTLYLQTVLGFSPVKSGLSFLPITFVIAITSGVVSNLLVKVGYRKFLIMGPIFMGLSLFYLGHVPVNGTYFGNVFWGLILMAIGMGMNFVSITVAATASVPKNESGLASGLLNTSQQIGGALGLAILSGVAASKTKEVLASSFGHINQAAIIQAQVAGYQRAFYFSIIFAVLAFTFSLLLIRQYPTKQEPENVTL